MPANLDDKLVVALSSRALFDFEEENAEFDENDPRSYERLQLSRLNQPAAQGAAFKLVKKLLAFNTPQAHKVEVVILSRNDPVTGLRVFKSAEQHGAEGDFKAAGSLEELAQILTPPRAILLMVKAGSAGRRSDRIAVKACSTPGDTIIDGGNSLFHDTRRRAAARPRARAWGSSVPVSQAVKRARCAGRASCPAARASRTSASRRC